MKMSDSIGLEIERREAERLKPYEPWEVVSCPSCGEEWFPEDSLEKIRELNANIDALTAEVEEQARLLGASGSREAELLARVEALEKKLTKVYNALLAGIANAAAANYAEREMEAKRRLRDAMQEPSP